MNPDPELYAEDPLEDESKKEIKKRYTSFFLAANGTPVEMLYDPAQPRTQFVFLDELGTPKYIN